MRASIFVTHDNTNILIDTSPDLRQQALNNKITSLDGVLYTHSHADHIAGIDDLKSFAFRSQRPVPVYSDPKTIQELMTRFGYIFAEPQKSIDYPAGGRDFAFATPNIIEPNTKFKIGEVDFLAFKQPHGKIHSLGFRSGDFAYSTDVHKFDEHSLANLKNLKLWIIDCVGYKTYPAHLGLEQTLYWIDRIRPQNAILTHMSHEIDYSDIAQKLPANVIPGYDGMQIEI